MYARSTTFQARPESVDSGVRIFRDEVMTPLQSMRGCVGVSMIADRRSSRCIATTAWRTLEDMHASVAAVRPMRERVSKALGGFAEVEEWDIAAVHRERHASEESCMRVTWLRVDSGQVASVVEAFRFRSLPAMTTRRSFCGASLLMHREWSRAVVSVSYRDHEAMEGNHGLVGMVSSDGTSDAGIGIIEVREFDVVMAHLHVPELA